MYNELFITASKWQPWPQTNQCNANLECYNSKEQSCCVSRIRPIGKRSVALSQLKRGTCQTFGGEGDGK